MNFRSRRGLVLSILSKINSKDGTTVEVGAVLGSVSENGTDSVKKVEIKKIELLKTGDKKFTQSVELIIVAGEKLSKKEILVEFEE